MNDLWGKVIKGLECCSQMVGEVCRECPYANECEEGEGLLAGSAHLAADALSLLKAQEQTRFIDKGDDFAPDGEIVRRWECESCGTWVYSKSDLRPGFRYCANCGRAVKWDG